MRNVFDSYFVSCVDFSPDGRLIALVTYFHGGLGIWNWRDGSRKIFVQNFELEIYDIHFSPDGQCIAAGLSSGDVLIWNARTGQLVEKLTGHRDCVNSVAFMPDGMGLISGSDDKSVKLWDLSFLGMGGSRSQQWDGQMGTGKEVLNFTGHKVCC
jgi:glucose repression regulatory protein TUP1